MDTEQNDGRFENACTNVLKFSNEHTQQNLTESEQEYLSLEPVIQSMIESMSSLLQQWRNLIVTLYLGTDSILNGVHR